MKRFLLKLWTAIRNFFCPKKSDMKIFNKVVWGKVAPENKNDIWFDGSTFRHYKNDYWFPMTLTKEEVQEMLKSIEVKSVTPDWKASEGEEGFIKNKPFSLGTLFLTLNDNTFSEYVGEFLDLYCVYKGNIQQLRSGTKVGILWGSDDYELSLEYNDSGELYFVGGGILEEPVYIYEGITKIDSIFLHDSIVKTLVIKRDMWIPEAYVGSVYDPINDVWLPEALKCVLDITDSTVAPGTKKYAVPISIQGNILTASNNTEFTLKYGHVI